MRRLSRSTLPSVDRALRPRVDPASLGVGIVHLGIGAFHRAHQAVYTEDALAAAAAGGAADLNWGICGVTQRSPAVVAQLGPQDGLYSILQRGAQHTDLRVVGTVRDLLFAAAAGDRLTALLATSRTRLVTLTVTEKGYRHDPATGRLLTSDPQIVADLAGRAPGTAVGQLVRGLAARRGLDGGPVTLLSCDNLPANGEVLRRLLLEFCALLPTTEGEPLAEWITANVAFPSCVVDRIVPATTESDRTEAAARLRLTDCGVVVTEPFRQWVVQDTFAAGRPPWELAGAILTADIEPYEALKLRLLNGSHSTLAYLGALADLPYICDAIKVPGLETLVTRFMAEEVVPTLAIPDGFDVPAYQRELLERFANPALRHRSTQIAMDGSQKLPQRLLATIRDRLAAGAEPRLACLGVAAWMRYVWCGRTEGGAPLPIDDPLSGRLRELTSPASTPADVVNALLSLTPVFGLDLPQHPIFRELVTDELAALSRNGIRDTVRAIAAE